MTTAEYKAAVLRAAELSRKLTAQLDEEGLDLFEEYCENYKNIVEYEINS